MMLESMEVFESMEVTGESAIINYPLARLTLNCYVLLFLNDCFSNVYSLAWTIFARSKLYFSLRGHAIRM